MGKGISIKARKAKARGGQQEIRDMLYDVIPGSEKDDIKSTVMGDGGTDIQLSPAAFKHAPLQIEVKRREDSLKMVYTWLGQAKEHGPGMPVLFYRSDRREWLAILPTEDYMELLRKSIQYDILTKEDEQDD